MKLPQLLSAAAGLALVASTSTSSFAFMADSPVVGQSITNPTGMVAQLREEVAAGKTECGVLLNKVNEALAVIDTQLDAGVADEAAYLDARSNLVGIRSDLPCLGEELAANQTELDQSQVISDTLLSEQTIGSSILDGNAAAGAANMGGAPMGGMSYGGGGGGGGSMGGGGIGGIGAIGALGAAIAVGASNNNNNLPGIVISPSSL